jgi:hypothetical protein
MSEGGLAAGAEGRYWQLRTGNGLLSSRRAPLFFEARNFSSFISFKISRELWRAFRRIVHGQSLHCVCWSARSAIFNLEILCH